MLRVRFKITDMISETVFDAITCAIEVLLDEGEITTEEAKQIKETLDFTLEWR